MPTAPSGAARGGKDLPSEQPVLLLANITKRFGALQVLDAASLAVHPGELAWLGGRNGIGKTTLLRITAGLLLPESGKISLRELDSRRDRRQFQRRLGFLSAGNSGLYANLTVVDNLQLWAALALLPRGSRRGAVEASIERFELRSFAERRADRLSMGQRQRVRLAMAFLHEPQVLLLDEPFTSLDERGRELLNRAAGEHTARGGGGVWCSPMPEQDGPRFESTYVIEQGRVVAA